MSIIFQSTFILFASNSEQIFIESINNSWVSSSLFPNIQCLYTNIPDFMN